MVNLIVTDNVIPADDPKAMSCRLDLDISIHALGQQIEKTVDSLDRIWPALRLPLVST